MKNTHELNSISELCEADSHNQLTDLDPLGMDSDSLIQDFRHYFTHTLGRDRRCCSNHYYYKALAQTLRDRLMERWKNTRYAYDEGNCKRTYYLSMEFLMGRALRNAMLNLDVEADVKDGLEELGIVMEDLVEMEHDAGLGNGGLGRLAACFLDSCATLQLPVTGYGIRYEYGMFRQVIEDGYQLEEPDHWLRDGNPWELERPEYAQRIHFGGRTEHFVDPEGKHHARWVDTHDVLAVPFDNPVPGYRNGTVNTLRLWKAAATDEFDLDEFNAGDYADAVEAKNQAEHISMVLYPNDASENGKALRLRQQYFLASASLKDVIRGWKRAHKDFSEFSSKNCFQLNDTHPTIAVAELMRLLVDIERLDWDDAWEITSQTMAYTNHTLLPEALERWSVPLFKQLLPRLLEVIYEINARFLSEVSARWPMDTQRLGRLSIIEEGPVKQVRMAHLAIVGSFSVNGVAALHSELLKQGLFRDFYEIWPEKFNNKTNGVTQRRWMIACNPGLTQLLNETIGESWAYQLDDLKGLRQQASDHAFQQRWMAVRRENKVRLSNTIWRDCGVKFDPDALFDVQVKRMHEYKRQLLNLLHVLHLYDRIKQGDTENWTPRCVLFGGKAAPGYARAKQIIKLINNVARVVNRDRQVRELLQVAFLPNYRVTAMEIIAPGTDLSEQISTAGKEASGTGNMKFMMNGALTIGTLDGANIEIRDAVGEEHFFLFGHSAQQVQDLRPHYNPEHFIQGDNRLSRVMSLLESGHFNQFEPGLFDAIAQSIRSPQDPWLVAADFSSYIDAQQRASEHFNWSERWAQSSILNTACSGFFSTDRTMQEYNRDIWQLNPMAPLTMEMK
ncbi:MAG: glycogen/starch/alpha-glucan phosphorylase [Gammaproteobacteria bacterium SHHR-1]